MCVVSLSQPSSRDLLYVYVGGALTKRLFSRGSTCRCVNLYFTEGCGGIFFRLKKHSNKIEGGVTITLQFDVNKVLL